MGNLEEKKSLEERIRNVLDTCPENVQDNRFETTFFSYLRMAKEVVESFLHKKIDLSGREAFLEDFQSLNVSQYSDLMDQALVDSLPMISLLPVEEHILSLIRGKANHLRGFASEIMLFLHNMISYRADTQSRKKQIFATFVMQFFPEEWSNIVEESQLFNNLEVVHQGVLKNMEQLFNVDVSENRMDEAERLLRLQTEEFREFRPATEISKKVDDEILAHDSSCDPPEEKKSDAEMMKTSTILDTVPDDIEDLISEVHVEKRTGKLEEELDFLNTFFQFQSGSHESQHDFGRVLKRLMEVEKIPGHLHQPKASQLLNLPLKGRISSKKILHDPEEILVQRYGDLQDITAFSVLYITLRQLWAVMQLSPLATHINEGNAIKEVEEKTSLRLFKKIGSGGMGDVYLAENPSDKVHYAVKMLQVPSLQDSVLQHEGSESAHVKTVRFSRESLNLQFLSKKVKEEETHGGCVPDIKNIVFRGTSVIALVMQHVEGMDVSEMLQHQGSFCPVKTLDYAIAIASVLNVAHHQEHSVVHRDVKPSNIKIHEERGDVYVLDWGNSHSEKDNRLTQEGGIFGTIAYMAPEQVSAGLVDPVVDVYSFGATLYEMLSGKAPYSGSNSFQILMKISNPDVQPDPVLPLCEDRNGLMKYSHEHFDHIAKKRPRFKREFIMRFNDIVKRCMNKRYACRDCMKKDSSLRDSKLRQKSTSEERMQCCEECQKERPQLRYQNMDEVLKDLKQLQLDLQNLLND